MSNPLASELLTPGEVVARYKGAITTRTLANWRSQQQGPTYIKVGSRVLYPADALAAWEVSRTLTVA